jgi:hypothetical protein
MKNTPFQFTRSVGSSVAARLSRRIRDLRLIACGAIVCQFTSCASWQGNDGYRHTLVFGVGILKERVFESNAAAVSNSGIVGLALRADSPNAGVILGWANSVTVQIPTGWQGIISIHSGKLCRVSATQNALFSNRIRN